MPDRPRLMWREVLLRFGIAWTLAFLIWIVAATQLNPVSVRAFNAIPIQFIVDDDVLLANQPTSAARVLVRAQQSVLNLLTSDDIVVRADLSGRRPDSYTIPLQVIVNRAGAVGDSQPTQITAVLQALISQQKPIEMLISHSPPIDYAAAVPVTDVLQVRVSGAQERVESIVAVRGELDLRDRRASFETQVSLVPVDANGRRVSDVRLEPETVRVSVPISARDDVRQVAVRPNVLLQTLPRGYVLTSITYEPQVVYLSGSPSELALLDATISTAPISLEGRNETFEVPIELELPANVSVLDTENRVNVVIGIEPQISSRQFDGVRVRVVGLAPDWQVTLSPDRLSVVLNGAASVLNSLNADDIEAVLDVSNAVLGTQEIVPRIVIRDDTLNLPSLPTLLPPFITVSIVPISESTPSASATP